MEHVKAPFLGFLTSQAATRGSVLTERTVQLDASYLSLLEGFIQLIVQRILTSEPELPLEEELWLIDLADSLTEEKEFVEKKLAGPQQEDPLLGWHLHLRSQSGFELES